MKPPRILIIAGSDSGGGAGIQADIKTVTMLGAFAMTAITAITAQNTVGVTGVLPIPAEMVLAQIDAVLGDLGADAIKIGMIGSAETAHAVADRLERLDGLPIVFDPVMVATSGSVLADEATIGAFERLMQVSALVTPNAPELAALAGAQGDVEQLARSLASRVGAAVLAKGGDRPGSSVTDVLVDGETLVRWEDERIKTPHSHGTGCTLASAISVALAAGVPLPEAVSRARTFVRLALREAPGFGAGHGPMGHQRLTLDLPPPALPMLNHVTLPASDYQASAAFYRALGCKQIVASPPRYARFEVPGGMTLSIEVREPADLPSTSGYFFQCDDVDETVDRLVAAGIRFDVMPEDCSYLWRVAETRDPHGNRVCLYAPEENRRFPPWRVSGG
ncbi:MAG: bifunctional hydroxymethylpyrimidine kinase/phosphomethylpyrimidine kinase [Pseudomonadota bacterium]|nr:bifunctional hydroxymethylpyrimidine kinase/phosphomethylpyrimidine kinase [Pseudomonadota bacterium]